MLLRILRSPVAVTLLCLIVSVGSLVAVDAVNPVADSQARGLVGVDSTQHGRVLVLLLDGLRYETATDARMMPALARLRATGASGQLETVFEGFSIPAVRAALSGKAETQLVNAIRNFHFTALPIESVFLDASRTGRTSLVVGDEPFTQFGPYFEKRLPPDTFPDMYARDRARPAMALEAYESEKFALIVCHYESGDWIAHEVGIFSPRYAAEYAATDSVIARFAAARRPSDYLLVFGDHGHTPQGEHKTGLHIPTFGLFIGPDITPGVVFRPLQITNIRLIISHALGIRLHESGYQADELSRFLPLRATAATAAATAAATTAATAAATATTAATQPHASHDVWDYLLFAFFLAMGALVLSLAVPDILVPRASVASFLIAAAFIAELLAQRLADASWSAFPALTLIVAASMARHHRRAAAAVALIGAFFVSRVVLGGHDGSFLRIPFGPAELAPLYVAGIAAKLFLLLSLTRWRFRVRAVALTAALSLLEFRVWDHPAAYLVAIAAAIAARWLCQGAAARRLALATFGYAALYFTLRLPLYEYAWIDFFLVAVLLARRYAEPRWTDALVISGTFTLTSVWLGGGLEWGFLYGLLPAYVVELHVIWFLPLILLKIPLLLLLVFWLTRTFPSRAFVIAMLGYTGLRFAAVWAVRLAGGTAIAMWPLAEQGMYLVTFSIATVWMYRASLQGADRDAIA